MANRRGANEFSSSSSSSIDENDDEDDGKDPKIPDVSSVEQCRDNNSRITEESTSSTGGDLPRREENPFSFKHFLSKDSRTNYNLAGARPKIYSPVRNATDKPRSSAGPQTEAVYSRNPTELPDFVQDHLVIEQCYLNHETPAPTESSSANCASVVDAPSFGNFARTNAGQCRAATRRAEPDKLEITGDLPFDLTGGLERRKIRDKHCAAGKTTAGCSESSSFGARPDRLAIRRFDSVGRMQNVEGLPFDLPPPAAAALESRMSNDDERTGPGNCSANDTSVNKSLPDFLNDGPIRNRVGATAIESTSSLANFPSERSDSSLLLENERLRDELTIARRQIAEGTTMIESLKAQLTLRRQVDREETAHLEKAMEQVEANLKQSTKRAKGAENTVMLLKQQVKALTAEVTILRVENQQLQAGAGSNSVDYRTPGSERKIKKLSDELRAAATSAEGSLRQLMSGVNNLKVLASTLENIDRIEDRTKDYLPDFEEDNAAGPAL